MSGQGIVYAYRADGMRTLKGTVVLSTSVPMFTERYRHDGQMPIDVQASATTAYRNGLAARGSATRRARAGLLTAVPMI